MLRQLLDAKGDAAVKLPHDGAELRRYRDVVWVVAPPPQAATRAVAWRGESTLDLGAAGAIVFGRRNPRRAAATGAAGRISAAKLAQGTVSVRWRKGGEKFRPQSSLPRRSLKHLLQEAALPPWELEALPLLYCGEHLVWVPGLGVDSAFQAAAREAAWFVSWRRLHYTQNKNSRAQQSR
jgi:tRNA(Ile)-lysidine synthase